MTSPVTWIIVDGNYVAHRAGFSTGAMMYEDVPTGVIWGFLAEMTRLRESFPNPQFVFAFDSRWNLRKQLDPNYKANRNNTSITPELAEKKKIIHSQITELRTFVLPRLGYDNVFMREGYEADDVVAKVVDVIGPTKIDRVVIVSADQDMYQLLSPYVSICKLKSGESHVLYTRDEFRREFHGNSPARWVDIKAVAGCKSDNIPGCVGAGEKRASRYFAGQIPTRLAVHKLIHAFVTNPESRYQTNIELVRLPYLGCNIDNIWHSREPSQKAWDAVCEEYGFQAIPGVSKAEYMAARARKGMRRE